MKKIYLFPPLSIFVILAQFYVSGGKILLEENEKNNSSISNDDYSFNADSNSKEVDNPYVVESSFHIVDELITYDSFGFSIQIVDNSTNDFYNFISDIGYIYADVYGIDDSSTHRAPAYWDESYGTIDGIYTFEWLDAAFFDNTEYEVYSIDETNLAVGSSTNPIDEEILISTELNSTDNIFTTDDLTGYIYDGGFNITNVSSNWVEFSITVETDEYFYHNHDALNVTLKDDQGANHQTTATYVTSYINTYSFDYIYTYKITEIEPGIPLGGNVSYEIYSINNIGLAVGSSDNLIDDEILVEDELHSDGRFTTVENPYIENGGFTILEESETKNSITFSLNVSGWELSHKEEIQVKVLNYSTGEEEIHNANLININGNIYTYKMDDLTSDTKYKFISLVNIDLAVGSNTQSIENEINIENELNISEENLIFTTTKTFFENYSILFLIIVVIIFFIIIINILLATKINKKRKKISK